MKFLARNRPEWYTANEVTDFAGKFNFRTAEKRAANDFIKIYP